MLEQGICEQVLDRELKGKLTITDVAAKKFYEENAAGFEQPEKVRASHILISTKDTATNQDLGEEPRKAKRKVAEKIEYSPTTIYLYFESKADLLYYICEETFSRLLKKLESLGEESSDPLVCLRKGMRAYIEFGLKHPIALAPMNFSRIHTCGLKAKSAMKVSPFASVPPR